MSRAWRGACLSILLAASVVGAQPAEPIRVPVGPVAPSPSPTGVLKLGPDLIYVIDADVPCLVLASPAGLVSVTEDVGPVRIRGKFIDGAGKVESRTYKGKHVFTIDAAGTGRVELLIVPTGATKAEQVIRRTVDVDAGEGPRPPPDPKPKPPEPKPPDPKPATSFRVFLIFESGDTPTPAQRAVLYGKAVEDWLTANCTGGKDGWRRRDKDAPGDDDPATAELWKATKAKLSAMPCIAIERDGKVDIINLEATPAAMIEVLNKYKGK